MNKQLFLFELNEYLAYDVIKKKKIELIADIGSAESIRDFGGIWGVNGLYLFEGMKDLDCTFAEMIDINATEEFTNAVNRINKNGDLVVRYTRYDFRESSLYYQLDKVDVSLLYEVISFQDNHIEVMKNVAKSTNKYLCVAQPVMKEELFNFPCGNVLLQFYDEELKDSIRIPHWWKKEPRTDEFLTMYWMWGQTASYIIGIMYGYGWEVDYEKTHELSTNWNYSFLRFRKKGMTLITP